MTQPCRTKHRQGMFVACLGVVLTALGVSAPHSCDAEEYVEAQVFSLGWREVHRARHTPAYVRSRANVAIAIRGASRVADFRRFLNLDAMRPPSDLDTKGEPTRLVIDLVSSDGRKESYFATYDQLLAKDGSWRPIDAEFRNRFRFGEESWRELEGDIESPLYFPSIQRVVDMTRQMLKQMNWPRLARYYDLSGTDIDPKSLRSGRFFYTDVPDAGEGPPSIRKYKAPFPPQFVYQNVETTDQPDVLRVIVSIRIDQGGDAIQRGFVSFQVRRSEAGYQLLPHRKAR